MTSLCVHTSFLSCECGAPDITPPLASVKVHEGLRAWSEWTQQRCSIYRKCGRAMPAIVSPCCCLCCSIACEFLCNVLEHPHTHTPTPTMTTAKSFAALHDFTQDINCLNGLQPALLTLSLACFTLYQGDSKPLCILWAENSTAYTPSDIT